MKKLTGKRAQELVIYCFLLAFPLLQFCVFYIYVNINSILLSFKDYTAITLPDGTITGFQYSFTGFAQYVAVFEEIFAESSIIKTSIANSFLLYFVKLLISAPLGWLFSYYIYKKSLLSGLFKVVLFIPSIISVVVLSMMFSTIVDRVYSSIVFELTGELPIGLMAKPENRMFMLTFFSIWVSFGGGVLMYTGAMSRISPSIIEAGKLDGCNSVQEFLFIVFPMIFPTISTFLVVGVVGIFIDQNSLYSFYGTEYPDSNILTLGYYLFRRTQLASLSDYPFLSAFGILETLVIVPITLLVKFLLNKVSWSDVEF